MAYVRGRLRASVDALEHLVGGLGTATLALGALLWAAIVAVTCLVGVGLLAVPGALRAVRSVADRERTRLSRWGGPIPTPGPVPAGLRTAARDPFVRRELGWVALYSLTGLVTGLVGLALPIYALQDVTFPLWYRLIPADAGAPGIVWWRIDGLSEALAVGLLGVGWLAAVIWFSPVLARLQAWPGRWLLPPPPGVDLSLRVAELTATRAAALDAHAVELRRIERSLHDGTQNRLVAVNVLLGAARRAVRRNPDRADEILGQAQDAAEQALGELRTVVRGILPPVLDDRGLAGALAGLAGSCAVPCRLEVDVAVRCAVSVEATAYFVVAEGLTNVVRHSGASRADVAVRRERGRLLVSIEDDGHGDADEARGSGLTGIRRRVEAYDGRMTLTSPPGGPTRMDVELPCGS
ncbi:sensor histidine kinase [Micromonospora rubida]|uniref:sensor histidine kinase n=1 Tax=Micromonospora rubida TaxID=2697657 RepID=UPI001376DF0F|nr:sensor histidine kinase [Micromonospora rubida]NBE83541.1 sensor histidine kinase [Micromonospora rubida]